MSDDTQSALRLSQAIDRLYERTPEALPALPESLPDEDRVLLAVAGRLAGLNQALGPAGPALERRVAALVRPVTRRPRTLLNPLPGGLFRPAAAFRRWAVAVVAVTVAAVGLLIWPGRATLARFGGTFSLGPVEVRFLAPAEPTVDVRQVRVTTAERRVETLADAETLVGRPLLRPGFLPAGYTLRTATVVYYDSMPRWLGQPLFVDLTYGKGTRAVEQLDVRQYFVSLGPGRDLHSLRFSDDEVRRAQPVEIDGQPGMLLTLQSLVAGTGVPAAPLTVVVWQQEGLLLEVSAPGAPAGSLTADELVRVARSVK